MNGPRKGTASKPRGPGRPRSEKTRQLILGAARDLLGEVGYARLTIARVASRAGAGKSTIYRWWSSKGELVLDAVHEHIAIGVVPNTGSTRGDLHAAVEQLVSTFSDRLAGVVIFAAISTMDRDPVMAQVFRDRYVYPWRVSAGGAIQRGVDRGDLPPGTDVGFLLDVVAGTVFQRTLVVKEPDTEGLSEKILEWVLR